MMTTDPRRKKIINWDLKIFKEPQIKFRFGQKLDDPHDGLSLFGPVDTDEPSHPKTIIYGLIGTQKGIDAFIEWSRHLNRLLKADNNERLWPPFPGFETVFNSTWPEKPAWTYTIDGENLSYASRNLDPYKRVYAVVDYYIDGIKLIEKRDENFNVLICIVPDEVWRNCRPLSKVEHGWGTLLSPKKYEERAKGQVSLFSDEDGYETWNPEQYKLSIDFRRQIKARSMKYNVPIQIIRESTIQQNNVNTKRVLTPISDRAWNLSTAIYYKSGGKPWILSTARNGVCYIGISFRRTSLEDNNRTACCAAQMFLDSGDGIVFLGDEGPWYSPNKKQYHLSRESASKLLRGILKTYEQMHGLELKEIFLHSRSNISDEEFKGYLDACPKNVKLVGVRVKLDKSFKLFRRGHYPVLRGTFLKLNEYSAYLWASGFKPRLGTYDGWETPSPLRIDIQHGEASIEQVAYDIFGLTKLNYNACRLGDSEPVTIGFSDAVGEILVSNPTIKDRKPSFKFYI
ncbi:hypothetical protein [Methanocella conradii]|uniref:hypothetical protein n=1 Tax=Methanocella conradii TaxID=1175444 RepID=UPI0024B3663A|nr:hypothetical protein [Methanocella conradii]MDI6896828.1 hypothetical protein [Methanocella conradii]